MTEEGDTRAFVDPEGDRYHVRLAPREVSHGVSHRVNSVIFVTDDGRWVGSAPLYAATRLEELSDFQLLSLLREARLRG